MNWQKENFDAVINPTGNSSAWMNHDEPKPKKKKARKNTPDVEVINVDEGEKANCKVIRDALEKAIRKQFKKKKARQMTEYIDATPVFELKQFVKVFIYHLLWMALGPFSAIIIRCFEPTIYIKNLGFIPSCTCNTVANYIRRLP